ncbi:hypothetical protein O6H91_Y043400 [Diphasiastrum complanatum]|nr:hypothetical protein O6H91_Y120500 [Diphasiastrum complanatum]KAJ7296476.1 hypothetical protein O6H91_Y120500 [Diphasiastrum complanatum]KAJ7297665.1 hypothetical protein O6H91_Y043400 [Diphasiastrum complanatum]
MLAFDSALHQGLAALHFLPARSLHHSKMLSIKCQNAVSQMEEIDKKTRLESCTFGGHNKQWLSQELQRLLSMQKRMGDGLVLTRGTWSWDVCEPSRYQLCGTMQFFNITKRNELFIPEVQGKVRIFSRDILDDVSSKIQIIPVHPGEKPKKRCDGYWPAYITRAGESTAMQVILDIQSSRGRQLHGLQAVRLELEYVCYGPHGRSSHAQHLVLPLSFPPVVESNPQWQEIKGLGYVMPIRTHLLSHLDDPLQVLQTYALPHCKAGDMIAIGETPLAIMQGRFRHPRGLQPGLVAKLACRCFLPTSSLATACGMQSLIDISGRLRVIVAVIIAVIARLMGIRGMFYRIAGKQARLIDDVSGTLPPYDQYITLGPIHVQATVDALKAKTGCEVAVVDANDLRQVQILAASHGINDKVLQAALRDNPAG